MSFKKQSTFPAIPSTARGVSTKLSSSNDKVIYTNGKTVIIRNLTDPAGAVTYSAHSQYTTTARISPSGYYCASADVAGNVKIWDTVGEDQILKAEYKALAGRINDLDWDAESKRIIAVGDARGKYGHAFIIDTGASTGEISGHVKAINAVSIRPQRPYRAVTASDDVLIGFYHGAPYKHSKVRIPIHTQDLDLQAYKMIKSHTKFIHDIRYSPSGSHFASVGTDSKVFIYDGGEGNIVNNFKEGVHGGTTLACAWSPDSKYLVTSGMDRTVKLWDVETAKNLTTWTVGTAINDQQVGNAWVGAEDIVSLSLSGDLNVFDRRVGDKRSKIINGPQKPISVIAPTATNTFVAGIGDGRVVSFDVDAGATGYVGGSGHTSLVTGLAASAGGKVFSVGFDDCVREIERGSYMPVMSKTASQPKSVAVGEDGTVFVAEINHLEAMRDNQKVFDLKVSYAPNSVAAVQRLVAFGGEDQKVHLYEWDGKVLKEITSLGGNRGTVSALAFSLDGSMLSAGDSNGTIILFDVESKKSITNRWSHHTSRINSLSWTSDNRHCASGSLDTHVYIWSVKDVGRNISIKNAGMGGINSVLWLEDGSGEKTGRLASAGADACVRVWEITFHT